MLSKSLDRIPQVAESVEVKMTFFFVEDTLCFNLIPQDLVLMAIMIGDH